MNVAKLENKTLADYIIYSVVHTITIIYIYIYIYILFTVQQNKAYIWRILRANGASCSCAVWFSTEHVSDAYSTVSKNLYDCS